MADYQGTDFKKYLNTKLIGVTEAAALLDVSRQTVYQYFNTKTLSRETVRHIVETFQTAEEEIFGSSVAATSNAKSLGDLNLLLDGEDMPFIPLGEGQYAMIIPLVNEYAYAGYLAGFKDAEYMEELPKHTIVVSKHHKGSYQAFEVVGESMENDETPKESIYDGSIVVGRQVQRHLWKSKLHTHRWKDFVIVHQDGILIKRIKSHDEVNGIILLESLNPNKDLFPDREIHLDEVHQIFNIVNVSQSR